MGLENFSKQFIERQSEWQLQHFNYGEYRNLPIRFYLENYLLSNTSSAKQCILSHRFIEFFCNVYSFEVFQFPGKCFSNTSSRLCNVGGSNHIGIWTIEYYHQLWWMQFSFIFPIIYSLYDCYGTSEQQDSMLYFSFDYSCNLTISARIETIQNPFTLTLRLLFVPNLLIENNVPISIGFVSPNFKYTAFYLYYSYLTQFSDANSVYITIEGNTAEDKAVMYITNNATSSCQINNFPHTDGSCWATSSSQNNLFQINSLIYPTKITIGVYISSINEGFLLKIKNIPVMNLLNGTTITVEPITSTFYSTYIVYYNFDVTKDFPISSVFLFLKGLSSVDNARLVLNYDCTSCTYRDFPTTSYYCESPSTSTQFSFDYELLSTSCIMYVGVYVSDFYSGFNLTLNHYPQMFLMNRQNYKIDSIDPSYNNRYYYRT